MKWKTEIEIEQDWRTRDGGVETGDARDRCQPQPGLRG